MQYIAKIVLKKWKSIALYVKHEMKQTILGGDPYTCFWKSFIEHVLRRVSLSDPPPKKTAFLQSCR